MRGFGWEDLRATSALPTRFLSYSKNSLNPPLLIIITTTKSQQLQNEQISWVQAINYLLDACGTTLSGSGPLMPYDDRSNYEKGGAEQFFGWLVGWLVHYSWNYAKGSSEGSLSLIEDPSRGPQAHFFDPLLRDQNRGNARQQNAIGMPRGGCNRWPLIISNYILFYIACNLRGRFSLLKLKTAQRWRRRMKVIMHCSQRFLVFRIAEKL